MFSGCLSITNIKPLTKWKVANGINFSYMFLGCQSLPDIKELDRWNVSKKYSSYKF